MQKKNIKKINGIYKRKEGQRLEGDYIVKAIAADGQIRAFAATTKHTIEYARKLHNTSPVATAALGRLLTVAAMMGSMMKAESDLLTLQIQCDGLIGGLLVTADASANVKGYVFNPDVMLPPNEKGKLAVGTALGQGVLRVMKDMGLKEPYVGTTNLVSGEIAEDLTYYFATSEQVPSSVALGVLMNRENTVRQAGGFIIQLLPFAKEEVINRLEEKISNITSITELLDSGLTPEEILQEILGEFGLEQTETVPTKFWCGCERKRVERALISTGKQELNQMIAEGKTIEVNCQFCNKVYSFTIPQLEELIKQSDTVSKSVDTV